MKYLKKFESSQNTISEIRDNLKNLLYDFKDIGCEYVILEEKDCPKIKRKYELDLQRLFCSDYFRTKKENMPNVEKFLQTN